MSSATISQILKPLRRVARVEPIGLDVGNRAVKAVQLAQTGDGAFALKASAIFPRAASGAVTIDEARRIGDVLFRRGFTGADLVLAVPDAKLLTANLELPPRNGEIPLDQIARAEFARSLKVESESFEFAYWDLPAPARAAKATNVMGVGCRHADSAPMLDAFEAAGFELKSIEVEACALTRACFPVSAPPNEITAIVDIGWGAVRLFVVHQGVVSYQRSLSGFGMSRVCQLLAEQFDIRGDDIIGELLRRVSLDEPEDRRSSGGEDARRVLRGHFDVVVSEITTSLSYTAHQYPDAPIRRVLLCGGGATISGLPGYVRGCLNVDTVAVRAKDLVRTTDDQLAADPSLTLAIGLAQYTTIGSQPRTSNLWPLS